MLRIGTALLILTWVAARTSPGELPPNPTPTASPSPQQTLINRLDPKQLPEAIDLLRSNYVEPQTLDTQNASSTTLESLISRLRTGATLKERQRPALPIRPFRSELIGKQYGYIRLGSLSPQTLPELDSALTNFVHQNVSGIILDLRTTNFSQDYQLAADLANRFTSKGTPLFRIVEPRTKHDQAFVAKSDPIFTGPLTLLVDQDTAGVAECVAAVLRQKSHALLFGQKTAGKAVQYQTFPVGETVDLDLAVAEVIIPDFPKIFPDGIQPDLTLSVPLEVQSRILYLTDSQSVVPFITDAELPKTNEAALVAGKNPDLDAIEAQEEGRPSSTQLIDVPLQRAVDFLTTVNFYGQHAGD